MLDDDEDNDSDEELLVERPKEEGDPGWWGDQESGGPEDLAGGERIYQLDDGYWLVTFAGRWIGPFLLLDSILEFYGSEVVGRPLGAVGTDEDDEDDEDEE